MAPRGKTLGPAAPAAERGKPLALRGRLNIMHFPAFTDRSRGVAAFPITPPSSERARAFLYAFDLLELNGADLRREPIEVRKETTLGARSSSITRARWDSRGS